MSNFTSKTLNKEYGFEDGSYIAAGGELGLRKLCEDFYSFMNTLPEAKGIRQMHKESLELMTDKLTLFLSMWLGGPKTYKEKYKFKGMPAAHEHLVINEPEKAAWLLCMDQAIDQQDFALPFKTYLKTQLRFPAEHIRKRARRS